MKKKVNQYENRNQCSSDFKRMRLSSLPVILNFLNGQVKAQNTGHIDIQEAK